jgi:hypothetical protein
MRPFDKIYWMRASLGVITGLLAGILGFLGPDIPGAYRGAILAIAIYGITYFTGRYGIVKQLQQGEARKLITSGLGSFVMLFLFTWILYNTFSIHP